MLKRKSWFKWGKQFEYQTRDILEDKGYYVIRTAASPLHGIVDLIAISEKEILLVQCKRTHKERKDFISTQLDLKRLKVPENVKKELWIKRETLKKIEVIKC